MRLQSLTIKTALLIPYLVLAVLLPSSRGDRAQKYHFFQLTETFESASPHAFPVVCGLSRHSHNHVSLLFCPAKGNHNGFLCHPIISAEAAFGLKVPVLFPVQNEYRTTFTGPSPPLVYAKTVSGLSPPAFDWVI